jgi:lipopolysaccharide transport system ATP-binding protein
VSAPAVRVERIGKRYRLGQRLPYRSLRETLTTAARGRLRGQRTGERETIWALRDVSFEVAEGEVIGIIGRNGAGKSTLLKILARITDPTEGRVEVHGRVGSLLEVGTGFHMELTGRENIYLNGAILGMKRAEIQRKFDEIVAFAEIDQFLDTPVKHYSTGMYLRLAFAVAAHLEPEILLVDEVLAVGDAAFQKKCLGKMGDVASQGRTVLFVSHNMPSVRTLCQSAVLLEQGGVAYRGRADDCISRYILTSLHQKDTPTVTFERPSGSPLWMCRATLLRDGIPTTNFPMGSDTQLIVHFDASAPIHDPKLGFVISSAHGEALLNANNRYQPSEQDDPPIRTGMVECRLGRLNLMPGRYVVSLWFGDGLHDFHIEANALSFEILERDIWGLGKAPPKGVSALWHPTGFRVCARNAAGPPEPGEINPSQRGLCSDGN